MKIKYHIENISEKHDTIILTINHRRTVIGEVKKRNTGVVSLYGVRWLKDINDIIHDFESEAKNHNEDVDTYPEILITMSNSSHEISYVDYFNHNTEGLVFGDTQLSPAAYMKAYLANNRLVALVDINDFERYDNYHQAAEQIQNLYRRFPIYTNIITFENDKPKMSSLVDILFTLSDEDRENAILGLRYANNYSKTLQTLADKILENAHLTNGRDLMTQEQQVESFIEFSKTISSEKIEKVTDATLHAMKQSSEYARVTDDLKAHGFGLSKTQQFNALQSSALLGRQAPGDSIIYNLSDMGAGKTLMTVESIFLLDLKQATMALSNDDNIEQFSHAYGLYLPDKNLIAPKLSIKSSWIDTFKLFYNVSKIDESTYMMSFTTDGHEFKSLLHLSAFTARANAVTVDAKLPEPNKHVREYLIVDEIHQLVKRRVTRSKFFESGVTPSNSYSSFVLSGTLSNLTTSEWYNYVMLMGCSFNDAKLDYSTPRELENYISSQRTSLNENIREAAEHIGENQHRFFDTAQLANPQMAINKAKISTNKEIYFHNAFSSKVIKLNDVLSNVQDTLSNGQFRLEYDFDITMTPNFELFYELVGSSAITAQSTQIAEELFGKQKKQHNAEVINTPSSLAPEDIKLLRVLHDITTDYNVYKSQAIATAINNAILNLNDGLTRKNIYDLLTKYASSNTRFLEYLAGLDINILEQLPTSSLIKQPDLEQTPKFKVLKDIIANEPNETYLVVVNDADAMLKLAKALNIDSITKAQLKKPLDYQDVLDEMFAKQSVVIVPQMMIKSSLDLVQANRLIQYQLNTEISDIIQTQNRINRIGQTRETKAYYIATDILQKNIIDLFLETYKNIRVAHKGIVELFVDMSSQVNVVNDYIAKAMTNIDDDLRIGHAEAIESLANDAENQPVDFEFDDNGIMSLFATDKLSDETVSESGDTQTDDDIVILDTNPNQMSLLRPVDHALEHQLIPN